MIMKKNHIMKIIMNQMKKLIIMFQKIYLQKIILI